MTIRVAPLLIAFLFLLTSCGDSNSRSNEQGSEQFSPRILNGLAVDPLSAPQIVKVSFISPDGVPSLCTGIVLDHNSVLTAGHCITDILGQQDFSLTGTIEGATGVFNIVESILHPFYIQVPELGAIFNDVAILKTEIPHGLPALPLILSLPAQPGIPVAIYGYGLNSEGYFGTLMTGQTSLEFVTPNHLFSTQYDGATNSNPCFGDSGGPAIGSLIDLLGIQQFGIIGLVSTGSRDDCAPGDVTLFSNLQEGSIAEFILTYAPGTAVI